MNEAKNILVTGALGQIGSELVPALKRRYGADRVVASDVRIPAAGAFEGLFEQVDCTQPLAIQDVVRRHEIGAVYHMAALLSAVAEERPQMAWSINLGGLYNVLEVARQNNPSVFCPSSIGAFGPSTPSDATPQTTIQRPITMYGVTKVAGELLCDYYFERFGLDVRGLRLPGLISHIAPPGGGTTDYAVDIFYQAVRYSHYTCFLAADTRLDMMYMPDAIDGIIQLMQADPARLRHRNAFNVTAMNFTPQELAAEIRKSIPAFAVDYEVDPVRQAISASWPRAIDDSAARAEWDWNPKYDMAATVKDMLEKLGEKLKSPARQA
ncbi:MAG: NAD-dependent epimerase/dehydratase family protein [Proteobacteria bacterium]|nr:NAD-dependent epimerase/dehydratase family protein [Pseudomonadota bacterium]MDA1355142.1 NAD-dependent epimerase/dehydratase family protein [Pseudomonadota bacterium]